MSLNQLGSFLIFLGAVVYIGILVVLLVKQGIRDRVVQYFTVYIILSFVLDLSRALQQFFIYDLHIQQILNMISIIGLVGISVLLLKICELILPVKSDNRLWLAGGLLWTMGLSFFVIVLSLVLIDSPYGDNSYINLNTVLNILAVTAWSVMMGRIVYLSFNSHRMVNRPLHKNRLIYWTISLLLIVIGDVFFFRNVPAAGSVMHLVGVSGIVYILLTHNLIDIFRTSLQSLRYLIITFFAMLVYAILLILVQPIIQEVPGYNPLLSAIIMAGILAFLVNPIVNLMSRHINTLLLGMDYDPGIVMREYSQSVSNIVDLKLLEQISMNLIKNTFGVDIGHLYTVEERDNGDNTIFQLQDIGEDEEDGVVQFVLQYNDPIAKRFSKDKLPLTQYDLDYHPVYKKRTLTNSQIFLNQAMDVYVPIHQNDRWIGLFALGPKTSGDRYYDEEILLLETLADQSAVALENAKLFNRLRQMNKELTQAQEELEKVNARLLEIDQLKSAFISVITHEMRTPLSNLGFSLQIFEMYGSKNLMQEQKAQLEDMHKGLVSAQRMIDNLITYASFLNNQVELKSEKIDLKEVITCAIEPNQAAARDKDVRMDVKINGANLFIYGDTKLLTEAVYQLVDNAVKFTQQGGNILISIWKSQDNYNINIKDNGIGITEDRMENIWDAFVSISNPLQRGWEGLGLGLALVKLIVEAHGGVVWAQSEPGKGSHFGFKVPSGTLKGNEAWS